MRVYPGLLKDKQWTSSTSLRTAKGKTWTCNEISTLLEKDQYETTTLTDL